MDVGSHSTNTDSGLEDSHPPNLLLPDSLTRPLWKSLRANLRDRFFPEKLPPLQLTSRPVDIGMLVGDIVSLPWYRTVFTNLGNVINPETLPPLDLESRPVDVDELISDQLSHPWWASLVRNLADHIAPERLPALQLTSAPADASLLSGPVQVVRWSSLISLPKVSLLDRPVASDASRPATIGNVLLPPRLPVTGIQPALPTSILVGPAPAHVHGAKLQNALSRSRLREAFLIAVAATEALYLAAAFFGLV
jgi:hypothetical protein